MTIEYELYEKGMNIKFICYIEEAFCGCLDELNRID